MFGFLISGSYNTLLEFEFKFIRVGDPPIFNSLPVFVLEANFWKLFALRSILLMLLKYY